MTIYTVVSYKPSAYYRRGEEYWDSKWDIQIFEDAESAINCILNHKKSIKERVEYNDDDLEYRLLIDGRDYDFWCDDFWTEENTWDTTEFAKIENESEKLLIEWIKGAEKRKEEARLAEIARKEQDHKAAERLQLKQELELLAVLKRKHEK